MRDIVLSKRAAQKLEKLLEYLETEWSERVKNNYSSFAH
jgi:plasmid stabilization system protein ParE